MNKGLVDDVGGVDGVALAVDVAIARNPCRRCLHSCKKNSFQEEFRLVGCCLGCFLSLHLMGKTQPFFHLETRPKPQLRQKIHSRSSGLEDSNPNTKWVENDLPVGMRVR